MGIFYLIPPGNTIYKGISYTTKYMGAITLVHIRMSNKPFFKSCICDPFQQSKPKGKGNHLPDSLMLKMLKLHATKLA